MRLLPGFGGPSPSVPAPPPPPPTVDDPAIAAAKQKQQMADAQRRGRASTMLTAGAALGDSTTTPTDRPAARSAVLLGD